MTSRPWIAAVLSCCATPLWADPMTQRGTQELAVHVSPDFEGAVGDMLDLEAAYGYFLRERFVLRGALDYTVLEDVAGEDSDYRSTQIAVSAEYLARRGSARLVPRLGLAIGWRNTHFGDLQEAALTYGPRLGLDYFVADNVAIGLGVSFDFAAADVFVNDFVVEDTDISSKVGLRLFF
jgi:hypothetical protein